MCISYDTDSDPRSLARQTAVQFLHQLVVQDGRCLDEVNLFLNEFAPNLQSRSLAREWIRGTWQHLEQIDQLICRASTNWEPSRISLVDRNNLRLAIYQLLYCPDIPPKVVINEAIELARLFSTAQAPAFVNGVLDAIYHGEDFGHNQK
ncbi:MAG: transcription antitermination factor NusB [Sedimentisphaerales bacterium]|nr:transcription antitermination factor NusB [Sedimentisphaerales bacterium]